MFSQHLNKTTTNLLGNLVGKDKDVHLTFKSQDKNLVDEADFNSKNIQANLKYQDMYNKFNIDNSIHSKNMMSLNSGTKGVINNVGVGNSNLNNLKNICSMSSIASFGNMQNIDKNLKIGQININGHCNLNNLNQSKQVIQTINNQVPFIKQNDMYPVRPFIIPNIKNIPNPFMFVPKNLVAGGKSLRNLNGNYNSMSNNKVKTNFNLSSEELNITPEGELNNLIQCHKPNFKIESKPKKPKISSSDNELQVVQFKNSVDSENILNDSTRKNTEETTDKNNALLTINSEFFDCNYEEQVLDPYSMLNVKIKIGDDEYKELSLKQSDDIEQNSRDFCRENSLNEKFVPALCSMIHKAVDSLNIVFESDVQSEDVDYLSDIYNEYKEELHFDQGMDTTSLTNWSCLTVLDDSTDSLLDFSNTNLNITM
jgi:hypothetical protein